MKKKGVVVGCLNWKWKYHYVDFQYLFFLLKYYY